MIGSPSFIAIISTDVRLPASLEDTIYGLYILRLDVTNWEVRLAIIASFMVLLRSSFDFLNTTLDLMGMAHDAFLA